MFARTRRFASCLVARTRIVAARHAGHVRRFNTLELRDRANKVLGLSARKLHFPEKILIYHAGALRITIIALFKISGVLVALLFGLVLAPRMILAGRPFYETGLVILTALTPLIIIFVTTGAYVAHIHLPLPLYARVSPAALRTYLDTHPASRLRLTVVTMGLLLPRPCTRDIFARDLRPLRTFHYFNYRIKRTADDAARGGGRKPRPKRRQPDPYPDGFGPADLFTACHRLVPKLWHACVWLEGWSPRHGLYIRSFGNVQPEHTDPDMLWDRVRFRIRASNWPF